MRPLELLLLALAVLWFVLPNLTGRRGIRQGVGLLLAMTVHSVPEEALDLLSHCG